MKVTLELKEINILQSIKKRGKADSYSLPDRQAYQELQTCGLVKLESSYWRITPFGKKILEEHLPTVLTSTDLEPIKPSHPDNPLNAYISW